MFCVCTCQLCIHSKTFCRHFYSCCLSIRTMKKKSVGLKNCAASKVCMYVYVKALDVSCAVSNGCVWSQVPRSLHIYLLSTILTCWTFWIHSLHVHLLYHGSLVCPATTVLCTTQVCICFVEFLPKLQPRYYSVACSPTVSPNHFDIVFNVERIPNREWMKQSR